MKLMKRAAAGALCSGVLGASLFTATPASAAEEDWIKLSAYGRSTVSMQVATAQAIIKAESLKDKMEEGGSWICFNQSFSSDSIVKMDGAVYFYTIVIRCDNVGD